MCSRASDVYCYVVTSHGLVVAAVVVVRHLSSSRLAVEIIVTVVELLSTLSTSALAAATAALTRSALTRESVVVQTMCTHARRLKYNVHTC